MKFDVITIFPEIVDSYVDESILGRAQKKKLIEVKAHNPRSVTRDRHKTVDDRPFGGGPGMILMFEPIFKTLKKVRRRKRSLVVMLDPGGRQFTQREAERLAGFDQLILLSGRYEGFDARMEQFVDEKLSVGPYVLAGGELPALTVIEAVSRLIPGVLGDQFSSQEETFAGDLDYVEYPQYTRPETVVYKGRKLKVPPVLLSGHHSEIQKWRQEHRRQRGNK